MEIFEHRKGMEVISERALFTLPSSTENVEAIGFDDQSVVIVGNDSDVLILLRWLAIRGGGPTKPSLFRYYLEKSVGFLCQAAENSDFIPQSMAFILAKCGRVSTVQHPRRSGRKGS